MIIYKATNLINGKIYIGYTVKTLEYRKKKHYDGAFYQNYSNYFHKALRKYGLNNFKWETLSRTTNFETLEKLEIIFIKYYDSNNPQIGYNQTNGGNGSFGYKHTEEAKEKMRKLKLGNTFCRGKKFSKERRDKMSILAKEKYHSGEWISARKGTIASEETREKQRKSMTGKTQPTKYCKPIKCIETGIIYHSVWNAGKETGICRQNITAVLNKRLKSCGGFHWEYVNPSDNPQTQPSPASPIPDITTKTV